VPFKEYVLDINVRATIINRIREWVLCNEEIWEEEQVWETSGDSGATMR